MFFAVVASAIALVIPLIVRYITSEVIYLEEGAVLQGSSEVNDYAPKILSRFEGKEITEKDRARTEKYKGYYAYLSE